MVFLRLKLKRSWSVFPAATPASLKCVSAQNRAPPRPHSESPWGLFCGLRIPPVSGGGGGGGGAILSVVPCILQLHGPLVFLVALVLRSHYL